MARAMASTPGSARCSLQPHTWHFPITVAPAIHISVAVATSVLVLVAVVVYVYFPASVLFPAPVTTAVCILVPLGISSARLYDNIPWGRFIIVASRKLSQSPYPICVRCRPFRILVAVAVG